MACHEIAALRLGMMHILGIGTDAERQHELAELGDAADAPGPLRSLAQSDNFAVLARRFDAAVSDLEQRVATTPAGDPTLGYLRALIVLTKKVGLALDGHADALTRTYRNLEEMHDLVHELFGA